MLEAALEVWCDRICLGMASAFVPSVRGTHGGARANCCPNCTGLTGGIRPLRGGTRLGTFTGFCPSASVLHKLSTGPGLLSFLSGSGQPLCGCSGLSSRLGLRRRRHCPEVSDDTSDLAGDRLNVPK